MGVIAGNGTAQTGLGGAAGYGELALDRGDDTSFAIDVSAVFENGFTLDGTAYAADALYVSTDGFLTFGAAAAAGYIGDPASISSPFIAAFLADIDTRLDGEGSESGPIWVDVDGVNDVVTITWQDVGFYRRNADLTNTFQIQLFDRGAGGMDVVFRYDTILWTSGDLQGGWGGLDGQAATIGLRSGVSGGFGQIAASQDGAAQLDLPTSLGNTGVMGLWVFNVPMAGIIGGLPPPAVEPGGAGNDTLIGYSSPDTLVGNAGNDVLIGGGGGDVLDGGADFDTASYAGASSGVVANLANTAANTGDAAGDSYISIEGLVGSDHGDILSGNASANRIEGGQGNDTLVGGLGGDTLLGGAGFDWADYTGAAGSLTASLASPSQNAGYAQGDVLTDIEGIIGGAYSDVLIGAALGSYLIGGAGNDTLQGAAGADTFVGGIGTDWVIYQAAVSVDMLSPAQSLGDALGDTFDGIEGVVGSPFNDMLRGDAHSNIFYGGNGADTLRGEGGNDSLWGDGGNDTLIGGTGGDVLQGGAGDDLASYAFAQAGVVAQLSQSASNTGEAAGDSYTSIEGLIGSDHNDSLVGDSGQNWLFGGSGSDLIYGGDGLDDLRGGEGNDSLFGETGNDLIYGDDGDDLISGQGGNDQIYGGAGADRLYGNTGNDLVTGQAGNDLILGSHGDDSLYGDSGNDALYGGNDADILLGGADDDLLDGGTSRDSLYGGDHNDSLLGDASADQLYGGAGQDTLNGGSNADVLYGGDQDDVIFGEGGIDRLYGGEGNDTLVGGASKDYLFGDAGADVFQFAQLSDLTKSEVSTDVIADFVRGTDKLDLSSVAGGAAFTGTTAHSASGGASVYYKKINNSGTLNDYTLVYIDTDADASSEAILKVMGLHNFTSSDFIF